MMMEMIWSLDLIKKAGKVSELKSEVTEDSAKEDSSSDENKQK